MKPVINLAPGLTLPIDIAGQAVCIFGIRGSGKSFTSAVLAEELLNHNHPVAVIDPTDCWWGLRAGRTGKADDGYPIIIFGGSHEDVPLRETDGKTIAEFLVREQVPVILSLRHLRKAAQRRFVTEFCEELYHLKGKPENRTPLTVFIDEAPLFVPQKVMGETARTVGAVEDLIARGRNAGFGVVLISQRSATLNADVRTQADTIICHRVTAALDRRAIEGWFEENATVEDLKTILKSLATLKNGEAWIWAPPLGIMSRVQIRMRSTFDSSATPKAGEIIKAPKRLADVDLEKLKAKMAAAIEEKKNNDPHELKKRIVELESRSREDVVEEARKAHQLSYRDGYEACRDEITLLMIDPVQKLFDSQADIFDAIDALKKIKPQPVKAPPPVRMSPVHIPPVRIPPVRTEKPATPIPPNGSNGALDRCARAILRVLAQFPEGCTSGKLTLLSGYRYSGGFKNSLTKLRTTHLIEGGNTEIMKITDAGMSVIGDFEPLPTGSALFDYWANNPGFGMCERVILDTLRQNPGLNGPEIAKATGKYEYSGGFKNALTNLRTAGVVTGKNTEPMDLNAELRD